MAVEHSPANHNVWLKLLLQEPYPSDFSSCFSPCKVSSSPRSSLDMILECEENISDVRLDAIPESPEEFHLVTSPSTSAGSTSAGVKGTEEAFLQDCFWALARGANWSKAKLRTEDLFDSRFPAEIPSTVHRLRRTVSEPLPTIVETEDSEQFCNSSASAKTDSVAMSRNVAVTRAQTLQSMYMTCRPRAEDGARSKFEPTLSTIFEVEEEFSEEPSRTQVSHSNLIQIPEAVPLRLPAFFPGLAAVSEGKEEGPGPFHTAYPWGMLLQMVHSKGGYRSLNPVPEEGPCSSPWNVCSGVRVC